jgi:hypothetical protein
MSPIDGASILPPDEINANTSRRDESAYETTRRFEDLSRVK